MKHQNKLSQEQQQQLAAEQQTQQQPAREFATPEDLLRFDAANTSVPPGVAQRLQQSLGSAPQPAGRPWWRRIIGGSSQ
jgi:hypothetical protein